MNIRIFFRGTRSIIEVQNEGLYTKIMEIKFTHINGKPDFMRRKPRMVKHNVHDMDMTDYINMFKRVLTRHFPTPEQFHKAYRHSLNLIKAYHDSMASTKKVTS